MAYGSSPARPLRQEPGTVHGAGGLRKLLVDRLAGDGRVFGHLAGKTVRAVPTW
ncbi:hypothetical protein [Streptomyces tropicalis]|uniref:Uncharacterized protein n=1 Tax=Streptomyces tropicalis TaxID=3034234 RepID=A0ABT6AA51_9ACTN|nr:hypothetical protein [Streptomyces tropicalis]MDF3301527.1 hypothetical protein [Streptomyces tropicalis]